MNKKDNFQYLFSFIIVKSLIVFSIQTTLLNNTKGIKDIIFTNTTTEVSLSFKIPLDTSPGEISLVLDLSEPKKRNYDNCIASCECHSTNNLNCKIYKNECDSLEKTSSIIVSRIIQSASNDFEFVNIKSLASKINYKASSVEMTCSNFKLSFFLYSDSLSNNPYDNLEFSFPIFYRDKEGKAECILPKKSNYIPCIIDASKILFEKDYTIEFGTSNPIKVDDKEDNNIYLYLSDFKNYKLEGDCGIDIDNGMKINNINFLKIIKILIILFFMF